MTFYWKKTTPKRAFFLLALFLAPTFSLDAPSSATAFDAPDVQLETSADAVEPTARLSLAVSPERIYQGETARLVVRIDAVRGAGANLFEKPDVGYLSDRFDVEYLGATNGSNVSVSYINGVEKRVEEESVAHNFSLTPKTSGTTTIEPPTIVEGGKPLEARSVELQVVPLSETDLVAIETLVAPQTRIFPLVPFEVSVDVYVKELPEKYREADPIKLIASNLSAPRLAIPWLESPQIADATVPDVSLEEWLDSLRAESGFAINHFSFADPFDFDFGFGFSPFGGGRRPTTFLPEKTRVERRDANGETVGYWKYSFKRKTRAKTSGATTFGAATLKGEFLTFDVDGKPYSQNVYVASNPLVVDVAPIPEDDAPENYVGVFGSVRFDIDVSARSAAVGEALTLTATLRGYGSFDAAKAPDLAKIQGFDDAFKIYPATERSLEDGIAFDYKIRPTKSGKTTIPKIEISYFDVEKGEFVAASSEPLEIGVRAGLSKLVEKDADDATQADESQDLTASDDERYLSANASRIVLVPLAGALFLFGLFFGGRAALRANARRIALGNKRIVDSARRRLESGLLQIDADPAASVAVVRLAFLQLLKKRFARPIDSLTDAEVLDFLSREFETPKPSKEFSDAQRSDDEETLRRLRDFFQRAEEVRFGGAAAFGGDFRAKTRELFRRWVDFLTARTKKLAAWAGSGSVPADDYAVDR